MKKCYKVIENINNLTNSEVSYISRVSKYAKDHNCKVAFTDDKVTIVSLISKDSVEVELPNGITEDYIGIIYDAIDNINNHDASRGRFDKNFDELQKKFKAADPDDNTNIEEELQDPDEKD